MFSAIEISREIPTWRWTAAVSFTLQAAVVALALVYPFFHLESLPVLKPALFVPLSSFAPSPAHPSPRHSTGRVGIFRPLVVREGRVFFGPAVPPLPVTGAEAPDARLIGATGPGVEGSIFPDYAPPRPAATIAERLHHSVMMEGNLVHKVEPRYPEIAQQLHIQGPVVIKAVISRGGLIERAAVESGQPLLARAALEAVRQWRYRPYILNGEPIEVETEITVNFILQR